MPLGDLVFCRGRVEELGNELGMATYLNDLGVVAGMMGNGHDGEAYLRRSLTLTENIHSETLREPDRDQRITELLSASAHSNLGIIERERGNLVAAEAELMQGLELHQKWCAH